MNNNTFVSSSVNPKQTPNIHIENLFAKEHSCKVGTISPHAYFDMNSKKDLNKTLGLRLNG